MPKQWDTEVKTSDKPVTLREAMSKFEYNFFTKPTLKGVFFVDMYTGKLKLLSVLGTIQFAPEHILEDDEATWVQVTLTDKAIELIQAAQEPKYEDGQYDDADNPHTQWLNSYD